MQSKEEKLYRYFETGDILLVIEENDIDSGKKTCLDTLVFDGTKVFLLCEGISSKKLKEYKEITRDMFMKELDNSYIRLKELYINKLPF